ncbi:MAG: dipeptide ABC transporter ATP-binding protein [Burkholderiaceae bacterium]
MTSPKLEGLLRVQDLSMKLYTQSGWAQALCDLAFEIPAGQTFALVGESGCGKSMTALTLMQLLPDVAQVTQGAVHLKELDLFQLSERQMQTYRGRRISIIFQEPASSLNPVMRIGQQMQEALLRHHVLTDLQARVRCIEWLHKVGLSEPDRRFEQYPFELSGGQLQRVMIAMALVSEPDLLIADEPTTALDVTLQAQVLKLLKDLQAQRGMAMMLITHDLAVVKDMAHRVALMYAGEIVEIREAQDFFAHPMHPYSKLLMDSLPDFERRGTDLAAIKGQVPPLTTSFQACRFAPRCPQKMPRCDSSVVPMFVMRQEDDRVARGVNGVRCFLADSFSADSSIIDFAQDAQVPETMAAPRIQSDQPVSTQPSPLAWVSPDHAEVLLEVKDLSVSYTLAKKWLQASRSFEAVKGVSFKIEQGKTLALVGESGCGKTSLAKALIQVLGRRANVSGQVRLKGQDVLNQGRMRELNAKREMQIIFQNPFASLNPRMRISDILEEGMKSLHPEWSRAQRLLDIGVLLDRVGLPKDALKRFPHEFSGGQRQRIAIARALAVKPSLIICDEPTSALDVSIQAQILNLLRELQETLGVSYLLITHNISVVSYLAHEVAVMHEGVLVEHASASEVLHAPKHPYTQSLLASVPRI